MSSLIVRWAGVESHTCKMGMFLLSFHLGTKYVGLQQEIHKLSIVTLGRFPIEIETQISKLITCSLAIYLL